MLARRSSAGLQRSLSRTVLGTTASRRTSRHPGGGTHGHNGAKAGVDTPNFLIGVHLALLYRTTMMAEFCAFRSPVITPHPCSLWSPHRILRVELEFSAWMRGTRMLTGVFVARWRGTAVPWRCKVEGTLATVSYVMDGCDSRLS